MNEKTFVAIPPKDKAPCGHCETDALTFEEVVRVFTEALRAELFGDAAGE